MARLNVRLLGDSVLRTRAAEIDYAANPELRDHVRKLASDMFDTMYAEEGVGLAAPQIGEGIRLIVVDPREEGQDPFAMINPRILEMSPETDKAEEGCLSIPGVREVVERSVQIAIEGLDLDGNPVRMAPEGFVARILQHEVDHLDGILFFDRLSPLKRKMLLKKWQKVKPEGA